MSPNDVPFVVKSGEEFPAGGEDSMKRPTEHKLLVNRRETRRTNRDRLQPARLWGQPLSRVGSIQPSSTSGRSLTTMRLGAYAQKLLATTVTFESPKWVIVEGSGMKCRAGDLG
jgi:hypothetical protein